MEPLFENRYVCERNVCERKHLTEYVNKGLAGRSRRICLILAILFAALLIFLIAHPDLYAGFALYVVLSLFTVLLLCFYLFYPRLLVNLLMKENFQIHGDHQPETVILFGDKITMEEGSYKKTIEYHQVYRIFDLPHLYVLMFGKTNGMLVEKDSFTIGDFPSFHGFIAKKCVNVMGKK